MSVLPLLTSGTVAKYGSSLSRGYATGIVQFVNDQEQRWCARVMNARFDLVYSNVSDYDAVIMREFWISKKGMFVDSALSNTFSITDPVIPGQPYNFCYFENDDFTTTEASPNRNSFVLKIAQARGN